MDHRGFGVQVTKTGPTTFLRFFEHQGWSVAQMSENWSTTLRPMNVCSQYGLVAQIFVLSHQDGTRPCGKFICGLTWVMVGYDWTHMSSYMWVHILDRFCDCHFCDGRWSSNNCDKMQVLFGVFMWVGVYLLSWLSGLSKMRMLDFCDINVAPPEWHFSGWLYFYYKQKITKARL